MGKLLSPEKILRGTVILCLICMGAGMIAVAQNPGSFSPSLPRNKDLVSYFSLSLFLFAFYYVQYLGLPRFTRRSLNATVGNVQAVGSLALLLFGALRLWHPWVDVDAELSASGFFEKFWMTMAVLGETVFVMNVVWSYLNGEEIPAGKPAPQAIKQHYWKTATLGWPKSPLRQFGIPAVFFLLGGVISLVFGLPAIKMPVPLFGKMVPVAFGFLWLTAALPFGLFAGGYALLLEKYGDNFDERATRIHFILTFVGVFDSIRISISWQMFNVSRMPESYIRHDTFEVAAFLAAAAAAFAVNVYLSQRKAVAGR
jgi:heme/copper-type cytochrome/quinol oxidase subunit 1